MLETVLGVTAIAFSKVSCLNNLLYCEFSEKAFSLDPIRRTCAFQITNAHTVLPKLFSSLDAALILMCNESFSFSEVKKDIKVIYTE